MYIILAVPAIAGRPFAYQIPAGAFADPDGDTLHYETVSALPAWLSFDGLGWSGTPGTGDTDLSVDVWASDLTGEKHAWAADTFDISVRIVSDPDTDGDGIPDGDELAFAGDNWNDDADDDGLNRLLDPDSDNDGTPDGLEDGDGIGDWFAFKLGIAPARNPSSPKHTGTIPGAKSFTRDRYCLRSKR